ncbi:relaxin receptor 2 [Neodiprion lecontei]|uniref:Relaxin receptor 2 n=1 Tax=Neodiprion lecontei TaxID=441921 RepID=A0ABM3FNG6_NEOLC|nr:relaxin receptor 2 [Neodiprion lecontei]
MSAMGVLAILLDLLITGCLSTSLIAGSRICDEGHFKCNGSAMCVPQRQNCDAKFDCPDGSDEWNCVDLPGARFWDHLFRKRPAAERDEKGRADCAWRRFKSICVCKGNDILCQYKNLSRVPKLPSRNVMLLDLSGNLFTTLNEFNLGRLPEVTTLVLRHCAIKRIAKTTFDYLTSASTLYLDHNEIDELEEELFPPKNKLEILVLSSNRLTSLGEKVFTNLGKLRELDLRLNFLTEVRDDTLKPLVNLQILYLNGNRLTNITRTFPYLKNIETLSLADNQLRDLPIDAFGNLPNLLYLFLSGNRLVKLRAGSFNNLDQLLALNLNENAIEEIEIEAFSPLGNLTSLYLKGNKLRKPRETVLKWLGRLEYVYFDEFAMCRAAQWVRVCEPKGDGISSLQHLLDNPILRASVWMMAICACSGNILVLLGRLLARESNAVHSLYIRNLALSDLLMGLYLILIAAADIMYRGCYIDHEEAWRHSFRCNLCGFLSTLSCESSALILSLVTWDRFVSVTQPLARRQPSPRRATLHLIILWLASGIVAALPLTGAPYFGDEFYGSNGVCLSLHIHDPFAKGWEYSAVMFILVNTVALVFIIYAYVRMLREIKISSVALRSTQESQERAVAQRFGVIVATDCFCWVPIIAVKLVALTGLHVDEGFYAWLAVLVLPINSALNPVLYTLTTSMFKQQVSGVLATVRARVYRESHRRRRRSTFRNGHSESALSYSLGVLPHRHRSSSARALYSGDNKRRLVRNRYNGSSCSKLGSIRSISSLSLSSTRASDRPRNSQSRRLEESTPFIASRLESDRSVQVVVTSPVSNPTPSELRDDVGDV